MKDLLKTDIEKAIKERNDMDNEMRKWKMEHQKIVDDITQQKDTANEEIKDLQLMIKNIEDAREKAIKKEMDAKVKADQSGKLQKNADSIMKYKIGIENMEVKVSKLNKEIGDNDQNKIIHVKKISEMETQLKNLKESHYEKQFVDDLEKRLAANKCNKYWNQTIESGLENAVNNLKGVVDTLLIRQMKKT